MGKRIKLGIIYSYDENWIGGTYYYQNLIRSLNLLPDGKKPHVTIIGDKVSFETVAELQYPYLSFYLQQTNEQVIYTDLVGRIKNKLSFFFPKRKTNNPPPDIDVLFHPSEIAPPFSVHKHLYWIPDFQEVYLPQFFSAEYLQYRKQTQLELLTANHHIVFSSYDALADFKRLYPDAATNCYVVNFAVFHPDYSDISILSLKEKFQISSSVYFFVPNQFWKHKNHIVILKAVHQLKKNYQLNFQLLLSGKESDHRNPEYISELKEYVNRNGLDETVKFLGFIDRREQLCLMKHAVAIVQPSLFEGWSTVVEDAKAMNQNIIVSDLGVHREQLAEQAFYFKPDCENALAEIMIYFLSRQIPRPSFDYSNKLSRFGEDFIKVIETMAKA